MNNEEWYVIFNMNCKYEICRKCPKSGLFKGSYEECEKWIKQKKKEEKKDEMKNKISMALKDPILQQGFEIICRNLAELEKENAELKSGCRTCVYTDSPCVPSDYPSKDGVCSHYKNVFEENAELKRQLEEADNATDCFNRQEEIIAKAKELIKDFLLMAKVEHLRDRYETVDEAEQFISEVEK